MNLDQYLSRPDAPSVVAFAAAIGDRLHSDQVRAWRYGHGGRKPAPHNCAAIERASEGLVTCEELRPDLSWHRVRDKSWPHKDGRPCLDVAKAAA